MPFICHSSSYLINTKDIIKKGNKEESSYLSHSLTFLQLLVQQPADIKAVIKEDSKGNKREEVMEEKKQVHECFFHMGVTTH